MQRPVSHLSLLRPRLETEIGKLLGSGHPFEVGSHLDHSGHPSEVGAFLLVPM